MVFYTKISSDGNQFYTDIKNKKLKKEELIMPRSGQIIPEHLFPHNMVVVNDNTQYTRELPQESDDSNKMLFVFFSPKGEDGKIRTIRGGLGEFVEKYGQGPFSLYGQPYLNAYAAFSTGNIVGHCLRVTAPNMSYATSVLVGLYQIDETGKMTIRFRTRTPEVELTDLEDMDSLYTSPTDVIDDGSDDDGFTEVKLMTVAAIGKGLYGRNISYGVSTNTGGDKENNYKNYVFSVYENTTEGLKTVEGYNVCFNEDAIVDNVALFVDGKIENPTGGSSRIKTLTNMDGFKQIFDAYKDANPDSIYTMDDFDVLLGIDKYSRGALYNYEIDTMSEGAVVLNVSGGIFLEGGSDGDLDASNDPVARTEALNAAYLEAFSGEMDPMIASKNKFPTHLILDANYPENVKIALGALVKRRNDCVGIIDCGTDIKTKRSPITYVKNKLDSYLRDKNQMVDAICGKVTDPYSRKLVTVTDTFLLASAYPNSWAENNGKHVPVAGNAYGVLDGFIPNTIYPVYDEDLDSEIMDELCDERINFARINSVQDIVRATQTTRQTINSNLSEGNNVFILNDIKRDCEMLCSTYEYNFSEANDIVRFNKDVEMILSDYQNAQVRSIYASFDKNDWEAERGILHLYVEFVHKDLVKTRIIEIDVNRGSSSVTSDLN